MQSSSRPTHRALIITDYLCTCGNKWTHSYSVLTDRNFNFWGGTPLLEELSLPVACIVPNTSAVKTPDCFRCCKAPIKPREPLTALKSTTRPFDPNNIEDI